MLCSAYDDVFEQETDDMSSWAWNLETNWVTSRMQHLHQPLRHSRSRPMLQLRKPHARCLQALPRQLRFIRPWCFGCHGLCLQFSVFVRFMRWFTGSTFLPKVASWEAKASVYANAAPVEQVHLASASASASASAAAASPPSNAGEEWPFRVATICNAVHSNFWGALLSDITFDPLVRCVKGSSGNWECHNNKKKTSKHVWW